MTREEILTIAKPILFNTDMVWAILDGKKTETRRLIKPPYFVDGNEDDPRTLQVLRTAPKGSQLYREIGEMPYPRDPYRIGGYLYVRETWCNVNKPGIKPDYYYFADTRICEDYDSSEWTWRPSIHMPKEAARIFLRVTDVRVERLQDITIDDVLREGVSGVEPPPICIKGAREPESFRSWNKDKQDDWIKSTATATYIGWCDYADKLFYQMESLWNSTIKAEDLSKYGWSANPWVWVIEFERVEV